MTSSKKTNDAWWTQLFWVTGLSSLGLLPLFLTDNTWGLWVVFALIYFPHTTHGSWVVFELTCFLQRKVQQNDIKKGLIL